MAPKESSVCGCLQACQLSNACPLQGMIIKLDAPRGPLPRLIGKFARRSSESQHV